VKPKNVPSETGRWAAVLALASMSSMACADPCFDDGLLQGGCPEDDAGASATDGTDTNVDSGTRTVTATESDTATVTDTDPSAGTATGGMYECPELDILLEPQTPTIQFVVDQSGSMEEDFGGLTRWDAVYNTLVDPIDGVVSQLQSEIRFGLSLYTGDTTTCPAIEQLAPELDSLAMITGLLDASAPDGETPTGESFALATETLVADDFEGDKLLVLATDGEPDTCALPNPMTQEERDAARAASVEAVEAAYAAGFRTFVVSVGAEVATDHVQDLANAGVGNDPGDTDATFYQALDQQGLTDAFAAIVSGLRDCKLDLSEPLEDQLAGSCDLMVNGASVPYNDPNGWQLDGEFAVELVGDTCDGIQEGVVAIEMTCECIPQE
jgi:Mg-chelatase subunit ChlD